MIKLNLSRSVLLSVSFLLAIAIYWPGLQGPFLFDDFPNLEPMQNFGGITDVESAQAFVFGNRSGPTGRPVSMATFLLDANSWPAAPWRFKLTNLLFHLLTGIFVFLVARKMVEVVAGKGKDSGWLFWLPAITSGIWLLHPINVSTVLYVVQRMAILSALFGLASTYFYLKGRIGLNRSFGSGFFYFIVSALCLLLSVFAKENGALVPVFILLLELLVLKSLPRWFGTAKMVWVSLGAILLISVFLYVSYGFWGKGFEQRDFDVWERLFFQISALGDYALKIVFPLVSELNLFDGYYESRSAIDFSFHSVSRICVTLVLITTFVWCVAKNWAVESFGLLWFFSFHLMESSILPLELYFEHRNYLPSVGLIIFMAAILYRATNTEAVSRPLRGMLVGLWLLFCAASTFTLSMTWSGPGTLFLKWEMDEPDSARAKVIYGNYLDRLGLPENAIEHIDRAITLEPNALGLYLNKLELMCRTGVGSDPAEVVDSLQTVSGFDMGVTAQLRNLMALTPGPGGEQITCGTTVLPVSVTDIFHIAENAKERAWNSKRAARFYDLMSDHYAAQGNLDSAMRAIEIAGTHQPTVDLYLKAAVMLASAGLYQEALEKLEQAKQANTNRRVFYPSREDELNAVGKKIQSLMTGPKSER